MEKWMLYDKDEKSRRLYDQEDYLKGLKITHKNYQGRWYYSTKNIKVKDHSHCVFCHRVIAEDSEGIADCATEGYCFAEKHSWVCNQCFHDLKELFQWEVVEGEAP